MLRAFFELVVLYASGFLPLIMVGTVDIPCVYYVHVVKAFNEPDLSVLGTNLQITVPVLQMRK